VALWTLAALKDDYEVSLITSGRVDIQRLNEFYGTSLAPEEFSVLQVPLPFGLRKTTKFAALRGRFIQRYCQRVASSFDLMISAYNPVDFGVPGIQFIADFSFDDGIRRELDGTGRGLSRLVYGANPLRRLYLRLCSAISPVGPERWSGNLTVANSEWSRRIMDERFGVKARTVYPPVLGDFPQVGFAERENGFVCVGRLVPEKRIDVVIEVLRLVRQRGHDVHLHILGGGDTAYVKSLQGLQAQNRDWVSLEGWVGGEQKARLITNHRFGISGRKDEPFGIAVAEMVKAGCIVFVPNGGGQVETVDHASLVFDDDNEAVDKICRVLEDTSLQNDLTAHLAQGMDRFSVEAFQEGIRQTVSEFFEQRSSAG